MNKDYIIVVILIVIIIALIIGILTLSPDIAKEDSKLTMKINFPINEGDLIKIKLTDLNGNPIQNQTVNIFIMDMDNKTSKYSLTLNEKGKANFKLDNYEGEYIIKVNYAGNDYFKGNSTVKKVNIGKIVNKTEIQGNNRSIDNDAGAFYSYQDERMIYTGEVHNAPDGHRWKHLGDNEWERID